MQENEKRTELNDLGEFGLISHLTNKIKINNKYGSRGAKLFLLKWGISIKFFKKFYLKSNEKYNGPLSEPVFNIKYLFYLLICKINYFYLKIFFKTKSSS